MFNDHEISSPNLYGNYIDIAHCFVLLLFCGAKRNKKLQTPQCVSH